MAKTGNSQFLATLRTRKDFDPEGILGALVKRHGAGAELVQAIIDEKLLPHDEACKLWADSLKLAYVDPFISVITDEAVAVLPVEIAGKAAAIGLYVLGGALTVAMATPEDEALVKRLGQIAGMPISPVCALPREIQNAIAIQYCTEKNLEESLGELESSGLFSDPDIGADRFAQLMEANELGKILDEIIYFGLRERATDLHFEAQERQCRIRFRIDGNLCEIIKYSRKIHRALVSCLKIRSNLNIAETRFPQDGRFSMAIGSQSANFRVSVIPSAHGEKGVVRILAISGRRSMLTLDRMMMSQTILQPLKRLIHNPHGIIFVTGPTGSGKSTTLYAALNEINSTGVNISTIEDPIEMLVTGVNQSQINPHIDLKFSTLLRALLRQDPDVLLIGEIRDLETAKIATEAALTGHIVFATLHTNTAAQAIVRLTELGVEPYLVAPTILGVLAQRLAARICENCKEAYHPPREVLQKYFEDEGLSKVLFYRGRGCPQCRGTGYKGRIAIHELMVVTEEIRTLIAERKSAHQLTRAAAAVGYRPLRYDGLKKVLLGLTTIDEIEQNTAMELSV